jgi:hypothetical protein
MLKNWGEKSGGGNMIAFMDLLSFYKDTTKGPIEEPIIIL